MGASWQLFAITNVVARLDAHWESEVYFWATHAGAEIDLVVIRGTTRLGFEIKRATAPRVTPSMRVAIDDRSKA